MTRGLSGAILLLKPSQPGSLSNVSVLSTPCQSSARAFAAISPNRKLKIMGDARTFMVSDSVHVRKFIIQAGGPAPLLEAFQPENLELTIGLADGEYAKQQVSIPADDLNRNDVNLFAGLFLPGLDAAVLHGSDIHLFDSPERFHF